MLVEIQVKDACPDKNAYQCLVIEHGLDIWIPQYILDEKYKFKWNRGKNVGSIIAVDYNIVLAGLPEEIEWLGQLLF